MLDKETLKQLVAACLVTRQALSEHTYIGGLGSERPIAKPVYDTPEEYINYSHELAFYNEQAKQYHECSVKLEAEKRAADAALVRALAPNTWFKSVWDGSAIWIGYNTHNWGGYSYEVRISYLEPVIRLHHIDYK